MANLIGRDVDPRKDKRFKRLKHSDTILIEVGDLLQFQRDNGNIDFRQVTRWDESLIGMSTKCWRLYDCHKCVYRLKSGSPLA